MACSKLKLKLLIKKTDQKVLLAEAGKDVVDFLFSLLALPIGTIIKLITKESMAGSLGETYGSLEQLDVSYLLSSQARSQLLNPTCSPFVVSNNSSILPVPATDTPTVTCNKYYKCPVSRDHPYPIDFTTKAYGVACPLCSWGMTEEVQFLLFPSPPTIKYEEQNREKGVVKGIVMYTITDDLSVIDADVSDIKHCSSQQIRCKGPEHC